MSDERFIENQIKRINEYALWEEEFNNIISKKVAMKNQQFNILDKEWIEKWKEYVGYEEIKEKVKAFSKNNNVALKKEIGDFLLNINAKQKLEELGPLECSKIKKENKVKNIKNIFFDESSNFLPISSLSFNYFKEKEKIYANGDFIKGKCFLTNASFPKNEKKKIVILEKNIETNEINEAIFTLDENEDIKKVKEELSKKTIEEIMKDEKLKDKIIKKEIIKKKKDNDNNKKIENEIKEENKKEVKKENEIKEENKKEVKKENEIKEENKKEVKKENEIKEENKKEVKKENEIKEENKKEVKKENEIKEENKKEVKMEKEIKEQKETLEKQLKEKEEKEEKKK